MAFVMLIIGLIAFVGGAVLRRQQLRTGPVGSANPTNGFAGASTLISDYFRVLPMAMVVLGAPIILGSVLAIAFGLLAQ